MLVAPNESAKLVLLYLRNTDLPNSLRNDKASVIKILPEKEIGRLTPEESRWTESSDRKSVV